MEVRFPKVGRGAEGHKPPMRLPSSKTHKATICLGLVRHSPVAFPSLRYNHTITQEPRARRSTYVGISKHRFWTPTSLGRTQPVVQPFVPPGTKSLNHLLDY